MTDAICYFTLTLGAVFAVIAAHDLGEKNAEARLRMKFVRDTQQYRQDMLRLQNEWAVLYTNIQERARAQGIQF